jgi:superfamily II DNA or RNA helicase
MIPGVEVGMEIGTEIAPRSSDIVCASVATIGRAGSERLKWLKEIRPSIIFIDESHHGAAAGYRNTLAEFGAYDEVDPVIVVGCTATPKRLDRKMLVGNQDGAVFEKLVYQYPIREAIRDGYLSDILGYVVKGLVDLDGVKTSGGDFNQTELAAAVNVASRTKKAIEHWQEIAGERKTIVFCVDVQHAQDVAQAFCEAGIKAVSVNGGMKAHERKAVIKRFENGEAQVLTNVELATEGYDHPPINCVLMLRPTKSWGLFSQMIGRGTRICPGKENLIIIDVCDNTSKHNLATIPTILDLPPQLNLQGHSLMEAADAVDQLGENAQHLAEILTKATGKEKKADELQFDDLRTVLRQVDLLGKVQAPNPVANVSQYEWMPFGPAYRLSVGKGVAGNRCAELCLSSEGKWQLILTEGKEFISSTPLFHEEWTIEQVISAADYEIEQTWPDTIFLAKSGTGWRTKKPTEKQIGLLRRFGTAESVISMMSAGDASKFIDERFSRKRKSQGAAV